MEPRLSMVALGVRDLKASVAFYRDGLGWTLSSAGGGKIAFFPLGGAVLALYPWDALAEDAGLPAASSGFRGVTLAHNVRRREEVAASLALAEAAGGTMIKPAQDVFWGGHSGYFADLDGHLWEVAWNPRFSLGANGELQFP